jgi:hypothetical protein
MKYTGVFVVLFSALPFVGAVHAQQSLAVSLGLSVYPANGQPPDQQNKDETECYQWARQTTGVDPSNPLSGAQTAHVAQAPPPPPAGGAARGAIRGALIGNVLDKDASDFAVAGAISGGVRTSRRGAQQQAQAVARADSQNESMAAERIQVFKNAFTACMDGRKYSVK